MCRDNGYFLGGVRVLSSLKNRFLRWVPLAALLAGAVGRARCPGQIVVYIPAGPTINVGLANQTAYTGTGPDTADTGTTWNMFNYNVSGGTLKNSGGTATTATFTSVGNNGNYGNGNPNALMNCCTRSNPTGGLIVDTFNGLPSTGLYDLYCLSNSVDSVTDIFTVGKASVSVNGNAGHTTNVPTTPVVYGELTNLTPVNGTITIDVTFSGNAYAEYNGYQLVPVMLAPNYVWSGNLNNTWDTSTLNWSNSGASFHPARGRGLFRRGHKFQHHHNGHRSFTLRRRVHQQHARLLLFGGTDHRCGLRPENRVGQRDVQHFELLHRRDDDSAGTLTAAGAIPRHRNGQRDRRRVAGQRRHPQRRHPRHRTGDRQRRNAVGQRQPRLRNGQRDRRNGGRRNAGGRLQCRPRHHTGDGELGHAGLPRALPLPSYRSAAPPAASSWATRPREAPPTLPSALPASRTASPAPSPRHSGPGQADFVRRQHFQADLERHQQLLGRHHPQQRQFDVGEPVGLGSGPITLGGGTLTVSGTASYTNPVGVTAPQHSTMPAPAEPAC